MDWALERDNEDPMIFEDDVFDEIIESVIKKLGKPKIMHRNNYLLVNDPRRSLSYT